MKKQTLLLFGFIILKFILQYNLIAPEYDLQRDEYLHLDLGKHLAWGYLSVPPFTSWISWIILQLGNGVFWVKFFPALFGALTLYVVWKTIDAVGGGIYAKTLGATAIVFSALLRLNLLYQPNSADVLFWTLLYFTLIKYAQTENAKWLWYAAIAFAFGFLNKYNILFLALGLLPSLLLGRRKIFTEKALYYAALMAFFLVLPNLMWQFQNGFPVIHHMTELAETQLVNVDRMGFFKEQVLFFIGSLFLVLGGLASLVLSRPFVKYRFVFWSYVFTISLFIFLKAKGYYAIGLYPVLIAFGSVYFENLLQNGRKILLRPVAIAVPILLFIPIFRIAFPIYSPQAIAENSKRYKDFGLLRWEDGKDHQLPQDFADMINWKELAGKVDQAYATIPNAGENTIILCDNYGQAGAINYYTKFPNLHAVSFNADYIDWIDLGKKYTNAILVKEADDDDKHRTRELPLFDSVEMAGGIDNPLAREFGARIWVLKGAHIDVNARIKAEMDSKKQRE